MERFDRGVCARVCHQVPPRVSIATRIPRWMPHVRRLTVCLWQNVHVGMPLGLGATRALQDEDQAQQVSLVRVRPQLLSQRPAVPPAHARPSQGVSGARTGHAQGTLACTVVHAHSPCAHARTPYLNASPYSASSLPTCACSSRSCGSEMIVSAVARSGGVASICFRSWCVSSPLSHALTARRNILRRHERALVMLR